MRTVNDVQSSIWFNCGCSFRTNSQVVAEHHVAETGHTLQVYGTVSLRAAPIVPTEPE